MTILILWGILAISLALLGSNQIRGQEGVEEALTLVAFLCALVIFVSKLFTLLS